MYINTKNKYINLSEEDLKDLLKRLENEPRSEKSKERTREIISTFNLDNEFFIDNFISIFISIFTEPISNITYRI